jgi:opacity protein-like surface antigen
MASVVTTHRGLLAGLLAAVALATSPVSSAAQGPEGERRVDAAQPFSLGVDTSRFRISTLGPRPSIGTEDPSFSKAPYRLIDAEMFGTAVSFDLKLRWPSTAGGPALGSLAPYLSFGPTVLFPDAEGVARPALTGLRPDSPMTIGLSWGAGLSWRFARNAELFGAYRFMQFGRDSLSHPERSIPSDTELTGHDLLYGISVRF